MKRILILCLNLLLTMSPLNAQIFKGIGLPKGKRIDARMANGYMENIKLLDVQYMRPIYQAARLNFSQNYLFQSAQRGLVQIKTKPGGEAAGTGFLVSQDNKLYVVTARHVSGQAGNKRIAEVYNAHGDPLEFKITVVANGQHGRYSADVSLSEIPWKALKGGAKPFVLAKPDITRPAFSLGYTEGPWRHRDILPMQRQLLSAEGWSLVGTRPTLPLEEIDEPFGFSGYCGSPVLQLQEHRWQVVGMHVGSCGVVGEPEANRSFAVNLSETLPLLAQRLNHPEEFPPLRGIELFGNEIGQLKSEERVYEIDVYRDSKAIHEQIVDRWEQGFSEEHMEKLLEGITLQSGDVVYVIIERKGGSLRYVEWRMP